MQSVLKFADKKGGEREVDGFRHVRGAFTGCGQGCGLSKLIKGSLAQVRSSQQ